MRSSASTIRARAAVLLDLFNGEGQLTRAFAARGLGALEGSAGGAALLVKAAEDAGQPLAVRIQAVRGVALLGDARGGAAMRRLIASPQVDQNLQLEAITALAQLRDPAAIDLLIDLVSAQWPSARAAALHALAQHRRRHVHQLDLRRSIPTRTGRCARRWPATLGELARERARAAADWRC